MCYKQPSKPLGGSVQPETAGRWLCQGWTRQYQPHCPKDASVRPRPPLQVLCSRLFLKTSRGTQRQQAQDQLCSFPTWVQGPPPSTAFPSREPALQHGPLPDWVHLRTRLLQAHPGTVPAWLSHETFPFGTRTSTVGSTAYGASGKLYGATTWGTAARATLLNTGHTRTSPRCPDWRPAPATQH